MRIACLLVLLLLRFPLFPWGFYAHKTIHLHAILALPEPLFSFYRQHAKQLVQWASLADQRRYIIQEEGSRHYIDLDRYEKSLPIDSLPYLYDSAVAIYGKDSLQKHGILPWQVQRVYYALSAAFAENNTERILKLSADLGHYISDAHVPLHTCSNYNGQLSNQKGIHALWESRLPEIYVPGYSFFLRPLECIDQPLLRIWQIIQESHAAVDSVLQLDQALKANEERPYAFEQRNGRSTEVVSPKYCAAYHKSLAGMVERRMRASIHSTASFWHSAWLIAGSPALSMDSLPLDQHPKKMKWVPTLGRDHLH